MKDDVNFYTLMETSLFIHFMTSYGTTVSYKIGILCDSCSKLDKDTFPNEASTNFHPMNWRNSPKIIFTVH